MTFLTVVIVFAVVQYLGSAASVQRDGWLNEWFATARVRLGAGVPGWVVQVLLPVVLLWLVMFLLSRVSAWLVLLASVPVILWSLGRGELKASLLQYCDASRRQDNESGAIYACRLGANVGRVEDWAALNHEVLLRTAYMGLERWFVVIFWFLVLGPAGAVLYRVAALSGAEPAASGEEEGETCGAVEDPGNEWQQLSHRLCWLLEWPVVRLLGLTFALSGNFSGALGNWRQWLWDVEKSSAEAMSFAVLGALNINSSELTREHINEQELEALIPLLRRSLLLWICALAVLSLMGW
ncbi:regulatory signaling modulator protein AmpE [Pseudomaricurvus sp. HS19]|uniref:regulatory signaling modulator protein AmpE n=1 Tax=Pseudomaricurvus sp. HS19 TaxID=2692626 RepID=UPI00136ED970|nr:regulatory signaling modulator protein AmpE [Pseudomaricurvus sp. HS19]MYM64719.1 regulatory signaling modulator protein AmpE [Pseudomaricurvus sp. HS19]